MTSKLIKKITIVMKPKPFLVLPLRMEKEKVLVIRKPIV